MERILFCNIGWMRDYKGVTSNDKPQGGGSYNQTEFGFESCNFVIANDEITYGYVQPVAKKGNYHLATIDLCKIDSKIEKNENKIDNVTVIWVARNYDVANVLLSKSVVVGWYKNATVYRQFQKNNLYPSIFHEKSGVDMYNIRVQSKNIVLLKPVDRQHEIARAKKVEISGFGQSNVWYADQEKDKITRQEVLAYITNYSKESKVETITRKAQKNYIDVDYEAIEGNLKIITHTQKERDYKLVKKKKDMVRDKTGKLECEICGFDFKEVYGSLINKDFCEVHHKKPISEYQGGENTRLEDLAILCSNCHRTIHLTKPMLSVEEFRKKLLEK